MFRAIICSSSGGQIVYIQHLVSSLSISGRGGRAVHRLRELCDAKQAKQIYQYKKAKIKFYKNNAAIWYNETYKVKQ